MASPDRGERKDEYSLSFGDYGESEDLLGASGASEILVDSPDDPSKRPPSSSDPLDAYSDDDDDDEDDDEDGALNEQVEQIKRAYINEKAAPEILRFETELVGDLLEQVHEQQANIDDAVERRRLNCDKLNQVVTQLKIIDAKGREEGGLDPEASLKRHELRKAEPKLQKAIHEFPVSLYQMELDRVKYLLSAYLRVRIAKIQQQALYIITNEETMGPMLSPNEREFAQMYAEMKVTHFHSSVLQHMPEKYRALDDKSMMAGPNLDVHVFFRSLTDAEPFLPPGSFSEPVKMDKGMTHMIKYSAIRSQLRAGLIELR